METVVKSIIDSQLSPYSEGMTEPVVSTVASGKRTVTRRALVSASAAELFDLVADPHRHYELDGSGTIRDVPVSGPDRLSEGATFSVGMKAYGVPYTITSTVTAFETNRLIEWRHPFGHRWRWELEPTDLGQTKVTETWDYSQAKLAVVYELTGYPGKNGAGISHTLERLVRRFG
jgi:hypothetical protein